VLDLSGVGENLIDHLQARITFAASRRVTLNEIIANPWRQALMGAGYLLTRRGMMATPAATAHALARGTSKDERPTVKIQMHHLSGADRYSRIKGAGVDLYPGFSIGFFQLRPQSRGYVHAVTPDALDDPLMNPRYLDSPIDVETVLTALRLARHIVQQPALVKYVDRETRPSVNVRSDEELLSYIRSCGQTSWHPIGTCRMGPDDLAVVDHTLSVRGVQGLRVVDSSVMPTMPASNINAAAIAIGEKASELILKGEK
jgi:choline dehydrogenase